MLDLCALKNYEYKDGETSLMCIMISSHVDISTLTYQMLIEVHLITIRDSINISQLVLTIPTL